MNPLRELDPESIRIVLDLAHAELERMQAKGPNPNSIGQLAFDEVAKAVEWEWFPPSEDEVAITRTAL